MPQQAGLELDLKLKHFQCRLHLFNEKLNHNQANTSWKAKQHIKIDYSEYETMPNENAAKVALTIQKCSVFNAFKRGHRNSKGENLSWLQTADLEPVFLNRKMHRLYSMYTL